MTPQHALQLDAIHHALAEGDHATADAIASLTPDELAEALGNDSDDDDSE